MDLKLYAKKKDDFKELFNVHVDPSATVLELKKEIRKQKSYLYPCRQRITVLPAGSNDPKSATPMEDDKPVSEYVKDANCRLLFKDLGPQLAFRTVYLVEYLGPLLIYPIFALRLIPTKYIGYGVKPAPLTAIQYVAFILYMAHFIKRELETVYVHEFGTMTMPRFNIFKNSIYYWGFAAFVSWNVNKPWAHEIAPWHLYIGASVFVISALLNGLCHLQLKALRTPGSSEWKMPSGGLFEYVTVPNYFCEIITWIGFNILTNFTIGGILFNIAGAYQMLEWAVERHKKYKKIFPNYPKSRKIIIPFIY